LDKIIQNQLDTFCLIIGNSWDPYLLIGSLLPIVTIQVSRWYAGTILPTLFKVSSSLINPTRDYRTLDQILLLELEIQNYLAKRVKELGVNDLSLVFYWYYLTLTLKAGIALWESLVYPGTSQKNKLQLLYSFSGNQRGVSLLLESIT